jgi:hypothetical protein
VVLLFHGAASAFHVLVWMPVFITATLITAVNIAPKVRETLEDTWQRFPLLVYLGHPHGIQGDDLEQGQGIFPYQRIASPRPSQQSSGHQDRGSEVQIDHSRTQSERSIDLNSVRPASTSASIRALQRQAEGIAGYFPLPRAHSPLETLEGSRRSESPPWISNGSSGYSPPASPIATMPSMNLEDGPAQDMG